MTSKYELKYLDVMVQYACSLSCRGCIVMSNYNRKGHVPWSDGEQWLKEWSKRVTLREVNLMGGEPLLNKDLKNWMYGLREYFPTARVKLITNGFHYFVRPDLYNWCKELGNVLIQTSLHFYPPPQEYIDNVKFFLQHSDWKITATPFAPSDKLIKLKDRNADIKWHMNIFGEFRRPFMGEGPRLMPADNKDYIGAHKVCGGPNSPTLYKNKLYKCPAVANLDDTLTLFNIRDSEAWQPYLNTGLSYDDNLDEFVNNIKKPNHVVCKACSSNPDEIEYDHYGQGNVMTRKEYNAIFTN